MSFSKIQTKKQKGAAALIALIIISTVLLLSGITLVLNSIDLNKSLKGFSSSQYLFIYSRSCLEDAMSRLQTNSAFTGTLNFTTGNTTCQAVVAVNAGNPSYKDINVTVNNAEFYYSDSTVVNTSVMPIKIVQ